MRPGTGDAPERPVRHFAAEAGQLQQLLRQRGRPARAPLAWGRAWVGTSRRPPASPGTAAAEQAKPGGSPAPYPLPGHDQHICTHSCEDRRVPRGALTPTKGRATKPCPARPCVRETTAKPGSEALFTAQCSSLRAARCLLLPGKR